MPRLFEPCRGCLVELCRPEWVSSPLPAVTQATARTGPNTRRTRNRPGSSPTRHENAGLGLLWKSRNVGRTRRSKKGPSVASAGRQPNPGKERNASPRGNSSQTAPATKSLNNVVSQRGRPDGLISVLPPGLLRNRRLYEPLFRITRLTAPQTGKAPNRGATAASLRAFNFPNRRCPAW